MKPINKTLILIISYYTLTPYLTIIVPSAFFTRAQATATKKVKLFAEKRDLNQEAAEFATRDAATVAQAATNAGININNPAFTTLLYKLVKRYPIEPEYNDSIVLNALKGVQKNNAHGLLIAQAKDVDQKEAQRAAHQAITAYVGALAEGAHPLIAEQAACKAVKSRTISSVLAQEIAQASASDAGVIARTKGLPELINSITSKRVKDIIHTTLTQESIAEQLPSTTSLVSINKDGKIYVRLTDTGTWVANECELEAAPEQIISLTINDRGMVWMVGKTGKIFFQNGMNLDDEKIVVPGSAKQIVSNNTAVWMLGTDGTIYYRAGITSEKPEGVRWELVLNSKKNSIKQISWISLNSHNELIAIAHGKAYFRRGTQENPRGTSWTELNTHVEHTLGNKVTGPLIEAVITNAGNVWAINKKNHIFFKKTTSSITPWQEIPGALQTLAVTPDNALWGIDTKSHIFTRTNVSHDNAAGTDWKYIMTAPSFSRLFLSAYNPKTSHEYSADKHAREAHRLQNTMLDNLKRRIETTQKIYKKANPTLKVLLEKRINRLKNLYDARREELKLQLMAQRNKETIILKAENPRSLKKPKKKKEPKPKTRKTTSKKKQKQIKKTLYFSARAKKLRPGSFSVIPGA